MVVSGIKYSSSSWLNCNDFGYRQAILYAQTVKNILIHRNKPTVHQFKLN